MSPEPSKGIATHCCKTKAEKGQQPRGWVGSAAGRAGVETAVLSRGKEKEEERRLASFLWLSFELGALLGKARCFLFTLTFIAHINLGFHIG